MWASPSITTWMPVTGVCERSHAITEAAPRRNANGEAAMRAIRRGTRCCCRPAFPATTMSTGLGRSLGGFHAACAACGNTLRNAAPLFRLTAAGSWYRSAS